MELDERYRLAIIPQLVVLLIQLEKEFPELNEGVNLEIHGFKIQKIKGEEIKQACQDYMDFIRSEDYHEDDLSFYENQIFEIAINHFQGETVFGEINKIMREKE